MSVFKAVSTTALVIVVAAALLMGCLAAGAPGSRPAVPFLERSTTGQGQQPAPSSAPNAGSEPFTAQSRAALQQVRESDAVVDVYERVSPAVVNITSTARTLDAFGRSQRQEGSGSGFIIDKQGHIVTNQHVVANANRLDVTLADGSIYIGQLVVTDPATDLALIKLQAPAEKLAQLTTVPLGDSDALKVGQAVVAIGNPFGLERSASLGIVSSLGRSRPGVDQRLITNMIQTDAAINPGNSGGPLLNMRGEVIGINAQIEAPTRGNVGIGFAIPSNTLKRHLNTMLAGRRPEHAWIGISGSPLTPTMAEALDLPVSQGVLLATAIPGGPAAQAGLRGATRNDLSSADVITEVDGKAVRSVEDVAAAVDQKNPGDTVRVTYVRGGRTQTTDVTLGVWRSTDAPGR